MGCSIWPLDQFTHFSHHVHVEPVEEPESVAAPSGKQAAIKYNARVCIFAFRAKRMHAIASVVI